MNGGECQGGRVRETTEGVRLWAKHLPFDTTSHHSPETWNYYLDNPLAHNAITTLGLWHVLFPLLEHSLLFSFT